MLLPIIMAAIDLKKSLLVEVAPGRPASADQPATGPTYRNVAAKDGFTTLEGVTTLYGLFERRYQALSTTIQRTLHAEMFREFFTQIRILCG